MLVDRRELLEVLSTLKPGMSNKDIIEQSDSFIFSEGLVYCYNDSIAVSRKFDVGFEGSVNEKFYEILTKMTEDQVDLSIDEEDSKIIIKGKKSKTGIVLDSKVKITLDEIRIPKKWKNLPDDFLEAMSTCSFSASRNMTQPKLVCLHVKGSVVQSTDNYRLTRFVMDDSVEDEFLVPVTAVDHLVSYRVKKYNVSQGWVHFKEEYSETVTDEDGNKTEVEKEGCIFSSRVYEGEYGMDFAELIQKHFQNGVEVEIPKEILAIIDRASVFSKEHFTKDETINIAIDTGLVEISSEGEKGYHKERERSKYRGDRIEFNMSPKFLTEILEKTDNVMVGENSLKFETDKFVHLINKA